jgi:hypothetical protein
MPRSVIVVSEDPNLFASVRATLRPDSRFIEVRDGVHCDGTVVPLTNIYPIEMAPAEWDGWTPGPSQMPDPTSMSALIFECQSPEWVAEVGTLLAQSLEAPIWFVDAVNTAWAANRVDVDRIALA